MIPTFGFITLIGCQVNEYVVAEFWVCSNIRTHSSNKCYGLFTPLSWFVTLVMTDFSGYPGLTLAAVRDGEVVLTQGYGVADIESGRRVTADTLFNIASITKQFTALLLSKQLSTASG